MLRENWADQFFFEPLSEFISRLHEDRGAEALALVMFSPEGEKTPPPSPPVHLLVIYREPVDFLKEALFLRERDPSGIFNFFCYGIDAFRNMLRDSNPLVRQAIKTGLILFEAEDVMDEFVERA